jgi:hypothetical protein
MQLTHFVNFYDYHSLSWLSSSHTWEFIWRWLKYKKCLAPNVYWWANKVICESRRFEVPRSIEFSHFAAFCLKVKVYWEETCRKKEQWSLSVNYHFAKWLLWHSKCAVPLWHHSTYDIHHNKKILFISVPKKVIYFLCADKILHRDDFLCTHQSMCVCVFCH